MQPSGKPEKGPEAQAQGPEAAGKTVKVRMLNLAIGEWGIYQAFGVYEMPAARAESFIKDGDAERA